MKKISITGPLWAGYNSYHIMGMHKLSMKLSINLIVPSFKEI